MNRHWYPMAYLLLLNACPYRADIDYYAKERNRHETYSTYWPNRIFSLMQEHIEDLSRKTEMLNDIRFSYEESPMYEIGYIMGEVVERYRKIIANLQKEIWFKSDAVFVTIKRTGLIQTLYFEIYHLVNMMHEIPRKYHMNDDMSEKKVEGEMVTVPFDSKKAQEAQAKLISDEEERKRKKRQRLKDMKKMRELMLKGQYNTEKTKKPKNKWWPLDYGWEIDYFW